MRGRIAFDQGRIQTNLQSVRVQMLAFFDRNKSTHFRNGLECKPISNP